MEGDVEKEDGVLVIRRIRVRYRLRAPASARETVQRVHGLHPPFCPIYRTLSGCIDISTSIEMESL